MSLRGMVETTNRFHRDLKIDDGTHAHVLGWINEASGLPPGAERELWAWGKLDERIEELTALRDALTPEVPE